MKILIVLIAVLSFNHSVLADSPLTSTEISRAYLNVPIVIKASKAKGELTVALMKYLKKKSNPIAIKIAIINELGLNAIGGFVDENSDFDSLREGVDRKDNASIFYEYLNKKKKYTTINKFLDQADGDELICIAYLKAMDNHDVIDEAFLFAKKAKIKNPNNYTTHIICALIEAQQAMDTDWCLAYTTTNNVRTNKHLDKDLNTDAINIIFEYMDLYKKDCKTKNTQENSMKNHQKAISRNEAIQIAKNDANGFLGTWIDCSLKNGNWHINSHSKSANPPKYYVINPENGKILLRLNNTDHPNQKEKLNVYLKKSQENTMEDYKKAIELAEALMIKKELVLDEYNLVRLQNQFLYGKDEGMTASSVWEIIYKTKNTVGKDEYRLRGGEVFIEVDLKTQTSKITGWGE